MDEAQARRARLQAMRQQSQQAPATGPSLPAPQLSNPLLDDPAGASRRPQGFSFYSDPVAAASSHGARMKSTFTGAPQAKMPRTGTQSFPGGRGGMAQGGMGQNPYQQMPRQQAGRGFGGNPVGGPHPTGPPRGPPPPGPPPPHMQQQHFQQQQQYQQQQSQPQQHQQQQQQQQ
eukprot:CAMPEP_0198218468 /NCGR_PEP_ID=MMETSP1445-20131203/69468_1 /TAXON_ID=36898 /ORGANISM="Pyramimonas sp., Strain CCMP2087" /LENGTH=173 /DNA_ID=CAMNT_0043895509 /DNA_START=96 /DNA_END=614 /DNA_ORIENTATION=-